MQLLYFIFFDTEYILCYSCIIVFCAFLVFRSFLSKMDG